MDFLAQMFPCLVKLYVPVLLVVEFLKKRLKLDGWKVIIVSFVVSLFAVLSLGSLTYESITGLIWSAIVLVAVTGGGVDLLKELLPLVGTLKAKVTRRKTAPSTVASPK